MNLTKSTDDKPKLIYRIMDLQSKYKDAFAQLKWHLDSVYALDYEASFDMKDIDDKYIADFVEDISLEIERILSKYDLTKAKSYGLRTFTVKPKNLCIDGGMSLREFTENNFLPNKCGISFIHTLSYMEADDIHEQLSIMLETGSISNQKIEHEFSILSKFIEEVRYSIKSLIDFRVEFDELNEI